MSTIIKERLQRLIRAIDSGSYDEEEIVGWVNSDEIMELARIALASLKAEESGRNPVLAYADSYRDMAKQGVESIQVWSVITDLERNIAPLFTAPPAPVSVPDLKELDEFIFNLVSAMASEELRQNEEELFSIARKYINYARERVRAAMLQGAEPVTTAYKLPDDFDFDRFNDVVWLETVASNPHMHSPTTSTIAMVALELNRKLAAGNSPVIPDGWVVVPVEPTEDMIVNGFESEPDESFSDEKEWEAYDAMSGCQQAAHRAKLCWAAMISAAPKPDAR